MPVLTEITGCGSRAAIFTKRRGRLEWTYDTGKEFSRLGDSLGLECK
jgi:hypothetical protein